MAAVNLEGRVAIVTGAGGGLGREHALALARRGAKVLVNELSDPGAAAGTPSAACQAVVDEIKAHGGQAMGYGCSVTDMAAVQAMVDAAMSAWGRIDILVNNAGILRDKTFAKMSLDDFRLVLDVHLMGTVHACKAVWEIMRAQQYGRIVVTTSSSGLYGNFGQTNYGAAKLALVGFMQTLGLEGAKHNIRVNALAPSAATRMTQDLMSEDELALLHPRLVSPAVLMLASEEAPNRAIICAGAGAYECAHITLTQGVMLPEGDEAADRLLERYGELSDRAGETVPPSGGTQAQFELSKARSQSS
jgi:NAD(P)-dependent dehydrogenase (short-subunit alcohol dehydrogenase family)